MRYGLTGGAHHAGGGTACGPAVPRGGAGRQVLLAEGLGAVPVVGIGYAQVFECTFF